MNKGWISIHREIQEHWIWKEKREFSKLEAWIDILLTVNHSDQKVMIKNTLFNVKRGESVKCLDTWGKRWNWNKSKVRRFLKLLQKDNMIELKNEQKTTHLTVCNYNSYQSLRNENETQMKRKRNANETQMTPNNNDNNINKENKENNVDVEKENTFHDINILKNHYLTKTEILKAVIKNKENKVKDIEDLKIKLDLFCNDLKEKGRLSETWKEFSSYFRNCLRLGKFKDNPKEMTLSEKQKHLSSNITF